MVPIKKAGGGTARQMAQRIQTARASQSDQPETGQKSSPAQDIPSAQSTNAVQKTQTAQSVNTAAQVVKAASGTAKPEESGSIPQQAAAVYEEAKKSADNAYAAEEEEVKSLIEMMKEAKERAEEQREKFKLPKNTRYGDMPMEAYARLSKARTQAQASAAAGYARRKILQCKAALREDPDNAPRIRAVINSLQKAVSRAGKKRKELQQDQLKERQRIKAVMRKEKQKAQRLQYELKQRKTMRSIRERGYLRECEIENRLQDQMQATRTELRLQMQQLNEAYGTSPEVAAQQYAASAAAGSAPAAPVSGGSVDIQV